MNTIEAVDRVKRIDWSRIGTNADAAHCAKVNDFLKLASALYRRTGMLSRHPFVDITELLDVADTDVASEAASALKLEGFPLVRRAVCIYLCASELAACGVDGAQELVRIYEPLVDVFEGGGVIDMHHGDLIIDDKWSTSLNNWIERHASNSEARGL